MSSENSYRVTWQSAIDSDQSRLREDEFKTIEDATRFIKSLDKSKHRTFVRLIPSSLYDD